MSIWFEEFSEASKPLLQFMERRKHMSAVDRKVAAAPVFFTFKADSFISIHDAINRLLNDINSLHPRKPR